MENLEKDHGIDGRPLNLALDRISEDDEQEDFELLPIPSQKDRFDSARSSAGPQFSSKPLPPGLRDLGSEPQWAKEVIRERSSSTSTEDSTRTGRPTNDRSLIRIFTSPKDDADDEESLELLHNSSEGRRTASTSPPSSSEAAGKINRLSIDSGTTYHTAHTGRHFPYLEECSDAESGITNVGPTSTDHYDELPQKDLLRHWSSLKKSDVRAWGKPATAPGMDNTSLERVILQDRRTSLPVRGQRAALPRTDPENASPKIEQQKPSKAHRRCWRVLPWLIAWLATFASLCAIIGRNHRPLPVPKLWGEQQNKTERLVGRDITLWKTFSHNDTFIFELQWPKDEGLNVSTTNSTGLSKGALMKRDRISPIMWKVPSNDTWDPLLWVEHMRWLNATWVTFNATLTAEHKVNLTAICPQSSEIEATKPATSTGLTKSMTSTTSTEPTTPASLEKLTSSTIPGRLTSSISPEKPTTSTNFAKPTTSVSPLPLTVSQQITESRFITYVRNLLTCLWFLPLWLLALVIVERHHVVWLAPCESRARLQITAVVVSFMVAAALALATEEMVKAIVEYRHGR